MNELQEAPDLKGRSRTRLVLDPYFDNVVVKPMKKEEVTLESGVVIPSTTRNPSQRGTVLAVGPEAEGVEIGMQVLYGAFAGSPLDLNPGEEEVLVMGRREILGKIDVQTMEVQANG